MTCLIKEEILNIGKKFLEKEIKDLQNLYNKFPENIYEACEILLNCKGYVVVTGMGKSGYIGRKISATLSSTGTPSFFIHPSEASHGDLGMLKKEHVLLAISHSGESKELFDILEYSKKNSITIIGITANKNSKLGAYSDITITYPFEQEACFMNLAPTSSTLMMLSLGDMLAVCLYTLKNFTCFDFKKLHPGGSLGKRLLLVKDIMRPINDFVFLKNNITIDQFLQKIKETVKLKKGYFIVNEKENLIGTIGKNEIIEKIFFLKLNDNIEKILDNKKLLTCFENDIIINIQKIMEDENLEIIPVIKNNDDNKINLENLVGVVCRNDIDKTS